MRKTPHDNFRYRAVAGAAVSQWSAFWLTTERFRPLPYRPMFAFGRRLAHATEEKNIHTLYRKNFRIKDTEIASARLFISGDDLYKVYINGTFVGEGPAQSYPFDYHYNCYDVTDLLKNGGLNAIGVHVFYQGLFNIYLVSADNSEGMIAQLEITYADETSETIVSDGTWKYKESKARTARLTYGYTTQFAEDIDMNLWEDGWYDADYDLSDWSPVCLTGFPYPVQYNLKPQPTPPVKHEILHPQVIRPIENGFFLDFGKETVGTLALRVKGNPGDVLEIRFGEELNDDGSVRYNMRCNCRYQEYITLTGKEDFAEFYDFKGYRYAEILGIAVLDASNVWTLQRSYPFPDNPAKLESSDELMNRIWELCFHGVKIGTHDTYYDCPTREKGGFVGDALITGLSHLILTGDIRVYKKFIKDFANSGRHYYALMSRMPSYDIAPYSDYQFLYPLFLEQYLNYTGDLQFVSEMLPATEGVLEYCRPYETDNGLLKSTEHPLGEYDTFMVDWPPNYRDDYEFEESKNDVCTNTNGYYYGFLKTCADLYEKTGNTEKAAYFSEKAKRLGEALNTYCFDSATGLYTDRPGSKHSALHASIIQLYFGLEPPNGYAPIVAQIREKRLNCGVYFAYFVLGLLYRIGEYDLAYDLLSGTDEHSWANMLREGATACMEVWGKEQKTNTSWCHPWSSCPITFYVTELMGIHINEPCVSSIRVAPHIPNELSHLSVDFPIRNSRIAASFVRENNEIRYTISAPQEIEILFDESCKQTMRFERI